MYVYTSLEPRNAALTRTPACIALTFPADRLSSSRASCISALGDTGEGGIIDVIVCT